MYDYNLTDFTSITQSKPIHDQPLPFRLPFFGFAFTYVYIQKDGYLGFNKGLLSYSLPLRFPVKPSDPLAEEDPSLIAPWFSQQEIPTSVPRKNCAKNIIFKLKLIKTWHFRRWRILQTSEHGQ